MTFQNVWCRWCDDMSWFATQSLDRVLLLLLLLLFLCLFLFLLFFLLVFLLFSLSLGSRYHASRNTAQLLTRMLAYDASCCKHLHSCPVIFNTYFNHHSTCMYMYGTIPVFTMHVLRSSSTNNEIERVCICIRICIRICIMYNVQF